MNCNVLLKTSCLIYKCYIDVRSGRSAVDVLFGPQLHVCVSLWPTVRLPNTNLDGPDENYHVMTAKSGARVQDRIVYIASSDPFRCSNSSNATLRGGHSSRWPRYGLAVKASSLAGSWPRPRVLDTVGAWNPRNATIPGPAAVLHHSVGIRTCSNEWNSSANITSVTIHSQI